MHLHSVPLLQCPPPPVHLYHPLWWPGASSLRNHVNAYQHWNSSPKLTYQVHWYLDAEETFSPFWWCYCVVTDSAFYQKRNLINFPPNYPFLVICSLQIEKSNWKDNIVDIYLYLKFTFHECQPWNSGFIFIFILFFATFRQVWLGGKRTQNMCAD